MKTFFIAGYPKSGTSWLTKIISDTLNASIGGSCPNQDTVEPIARQIPNSDWIVRKGHYKLIHQHNKPLLNKPHELNTASLMNEPIMFIVRNPLDIVVSASFYHKQTFDKTIAKMVKGTAYSLGRWDDYVNNWSRQMSGEASFIRYEDLIENPYYLLSFSIPVVYDSNMLRASIEYNSFTNQKRLDQHRLLRKGIANDHKNHLTQSEIDIIANEFGETMERWDYYV